MKNLQITPYPAYISYKEGRTSAKLFTQAVSKGEGPLKTAINKLGNKGETEVVFLPPQLGIGDRHVAHPEGYALTIEDGIISIYASKPAGYLYGVLTLMQLTKQFPDTLPCIQIEDSPKWAHRGAQVCYAQINVDYKEEWLKKFVVELAEMKINTLYLYLEWRFWFKGIPATHQKNYIDAEGVKKLEALCEAYNIAVVPAINVMGHTGDFLGMEAFQELKEYDYERETLLSAPASALCPNNPKTRQLMEIALNDIMDAFKSQVIHVGGDEVEKIGVCPLCRPIRDEKGVAYVYVEYFAWIRDLLKSKNRKMGIWGDMLEHYLRNQERTGEGEADTALFDQLRDHTIIYNWSYDGPARETLTALKKHGFEVICSTSTHTCSVGALWPGQAINQQVYFKDAFELSCDGGLVTDWINGWTMHAENAGLNYGIAAALMWQGTEGDFAIGTSRKVTETAYLFQKYGEAYETMAQLIHLLGDADSNLLIHFPGGKSGSYLRKAAYLSINPMQVYMHYNQCLEGEKLDQYRQAVEKAECLWDEVVAKVPMNEWLYFHKQGVVLHRYLLNKYCAIHEMSAPYQDAAKAQWEDPTRFVQYLDQCIERLSIYKPMFDAPLEFVKQCHERLGLEQGSVIRVKQTQENYQLLIEFMENLKDSHRPLPSLRNIAAWLFEPPTTGFWEARNDEWYAENEKFRRIDIDGKIEWGSARW